MKTLHTTEFKDLLHNAEKEVYLRAYKHAKGNQTQAALLLGVSRGTLRTKVKAFGFEKTVQERSAV